MSVTVTSPCLLGPRRKRVLSRRQNVDTSLYKNVSTFLKEVIIQPGWYSWHDNLECLQPNSPTGSKIKTWFERHLHFLWEIEMANIKHEITTTLARFNWSLDSLQTIFWPRRIVCSIKWRWDTVHVLMCILLYGRNPHRSTILKFFQIFFQYEVRSHQWL